MNGEKITIENGKLSVPNRPIIPFIEGDGTGPDIWAAAKQVLDSAVEKAYSGDKKIEWLEVFAGEKSFNKNKEWLPEATLDTIREYLIAIKGPLTTPVGGGIRSKKQLKNTFNAGADLVVIGTAFENDETFFEELKK